MVPDRRDAGINPRRFWQKCVEEADYRTVGGKYSSQAETKCVDDQDASSDQRKSLT